MKTDTLLSPVHPGVVLHEDFMLPLGLSTYRVAKDLGVKRVAINAICDGKSPVRASMALKLGHYFKTSTDIWTGLQKQFEMEVFSRMLSSK